MLALAVNFLFLYVFIFSTRGVSRSSRQEIDKNKKHTMPNYTTKIINATLIPDVDAARALVKALRRSMQTDRKLKAAFAKNPRAVLADRGLAREYQNEFLSEMGRRPSAADCACTGCCATSSFCCSTM